MATVTGVGGTGLRALTRFRESFVFTAALTGEDTFSRISQGMDDMHGLAIWLKHMKVDDEGAVELGNLAGGLYTGYYTRDEFTEALEDVFTAEDIKTLLDMIDVKED